MSNEVLADVSHSTNMEGLKNQIVKLLSNAKKQGLSMHGDCIIGYFFKGKKADEYTKQLKNLAELSDEHWQEMNLDFVKAIDQSGIKVTEYCG